MLVFYFVLGPRFTFLIALCAQAIHFGGRSLLLVLSIAVSFVPEPVPSPTWSAHMTAAFELIGHE